MNLFLKGIVSLIVCRFLFDIIFSVFRKHKPESFNTLQNFAAKWGNKFIYKLIIYLILIVICGLISVYLELNYLLSSMILAFLWSLADTAFKNSMKIKIIR